MSLRRRIERLEQATAAADTFSLDEAVRAFQEVERWCAERGVTAREAVARGLHGPKWLEVCAEAEECAAAREWEIEHGE